MPSEIAQPQEEDREADLLWATLDYLRLSRAQRAHLLELARQTQRRLALLDRSETRRRKQFGEGPAQTPPDAEPTPFTASDERHELEAQIAETAALRLTTILSRLQMGLAWKLSDGTPAEWTGADPILFKSEHGFGAYRRTLPLLMRTEELQQGELLEIIKSMTGPPFPQRLAETADTAALAPDLLPFARRLCFSPQLVAVLAQIASRQLPMTRSRFAAAPSGGTRQLRHYRMERGFRDLTGDGPSLEPQGGETRNGVYRFGAGGGVRLPDIGVTDHYRIQMLISRQGGENYQKLIDFRNLAVDGGLYAYRGNYTFYGLASGGTAIPAVEQRLTIQRHRTTRLVQVFIDFHRIFAFIDLDDDAVFSSPEAWFFVDDKATKNEQGAGGVRWVTVTNSPSL